MLRFAGMLAACAMACLAAARLDAFRTDLVFAAVVVTSALSLILYWGVGVLRRVVVPWAPGVRHEKAVSSEPF